MMGGIVSGVMMQGRREWEERANGPTDCASLKKNNKRKGNKSWQFMEAEKGNRGGRGGASEQKGGY